MRNNLYRKFKVPIHEVDVIVIVTKDIPAAYKKEFGVEIGNTQMACCGFYKRKFVIILEPKATTRLEIIIHEIFHLTHRILESNCMNFDECHHEIGAYLCEYLTKRILAIVKAP